MQPDKLVHVFYKIVLAYACCMFLLVYFTVISPRHHVGESTILLHDRLSDREDTPVNESALHDGSIWLAGNDTGIPLYSDRVINPHLFNFTIANEDACFKNTENGQIFLVILVKCRPNETYDRQQIMRTWGGVTEVLGRRTLTMFLIGQTDDPVIKQRIQIEDDTHHYFIQEDFLDAYQNMTYKNIMGLRWVTLFCPQAEYVMSIDSDMVLNIVHLVRRLVKKSRVNFAEGHLRTDPLPHRHKSSKWYTPLKMYPEPTYAPFLNGACYVMSGDVAMAMYWKSGHVRFLQWDDVFIGLVMRKVGVEPQLSHQYEQFAPVRSALRHGIATGSGHNWNGVNEDTIAIWDAVVGKVLQNGDDTSIVLLYWIYFGCIVGVMVMLLSFYLYYS
ncbi:beta-1,3-galactosyltransferase 1-like [Asterias rubens]|uniref:beta-1,3-galactosyltransferase 1-like n=1 Tax=Asterias rubens TaxID=7604 RepID=UPI001455CA06|nr:beta-1,3-galactosyltransferase 1-like [Asterias rubens]